MHLFCLRLNIFFVFLFTVTAIAQEHLVGPIAICEGSAPKNAIEAMAQIGCGGIVVISYPDDANGNSVMGQDMYGSHYQPVYHMAQMQLPAASIQEVIKNVNQSQTAAQFSLSEENVIVQIPVGSSDGTQVISALDIPLQMSADVEFDLNEISPDFYDLNSALKAVLARQNSPIKSVRITPFPKRAPYYRWGTAQRDVLPVIRANPELTLRNILLQIRQHIPELVWVINVQGNEISINTTTIRLTRTTLPLTAIIRNLFVTDDEVRGYKTKFERIRDASRELYRRLKLEPETTEAALEHSDVLEDMITNAFAENETDVSHHLHYLFCLRHPTITKLLLANMKVVPKKVSDPIYFLVIPGINGGSPGWEEMYTPIWKEAQKSGNPILSEHAEQMLLKK